MRKIPFTLQIQRGFLQKQSTYNKTLLYHLQQEVQSNIWRHSSLAFHGDIPHFFSNTLMVLPNARVLTSWLNISQNFVISCEGWRTRGLQWLPSRTERLSATNEPHFKLHLHYSTEVLNTRRLGYALCNAETKSRLHCVNKVQGKTMLQLYNTRVDLFKKGVGMAFWGGRQGEDWGGGEWGW